MVKSMTGFGRNQTISEGYDVTCEIRGVNHRYFDPYIRLSRRYAFLEDRIKKELKEYVSRGRIEIAITIEKTEESNKIIKVDKDLAIAYYNYLKELAEKLDISTGIKVVDVFRLPEVFSLEAREEDLEILWVVLKQSIGVAMESLVEMRIKEGQNLARDILKRNKKILSMVENLEKMAPEVTRDYSEKLRKRILEMVSNEFIDEQRIMQETAIFADKSSITEEIVRLKSHIRHLDEFMNSEEAVGRKCDFLVQEMFREINTIASKANDMEMSLVVVEIKAELEKIREQLQNIE